MHYTSILLGCILILLASCAQPTTDSALSEEQPVLFYDVSSMIGLVTEVDNKYGGPSVFNIDQDGRYDLIFFNHNQTPLMYFRADKDGTFTRQPNLFRLANLHSIAPGDYDMDVLLSLGGGSGTGGNSCSQPLLNTVHFGLGRNQKVKSLRITWRNGSEEIVNAIQANQLIINGQNQSLTYRMSDPIASLFR